MKKISKEVQSEADLLKRLYLDAKRRDPGTRQAALARECGVSPSMMAGYLNGHSRIPDRNLVKLGELLGFEPTLVRPDVHERLGYNLDRKQKLEALAKKLEGLDDTKLQEISDFVGYILSSRTR